MRFIPTLCWLAVLVIGIPAPAVSQTSSSVPPVSSLVPRESGAIDQEQQIGIASLVKKGMIFLAIKLEDAGLDRSTKSALKNTLPEAAKFLRNSGATGVLLQARYSRPKIAKYMTVRQPPELSDELIGNTLTLIGGGASPVQVLALSFGGPILENGPGRGNKVVPDRTRDFWITRNDQSLNISEVNSQRVARDARAIFLDQARFDQLRQDAYREALTNILAASATNTHPELREEAAKLLAARRAAIKQFAEIDTKLQDELARAQKANRAADVFALTQALAGLGDSVLASNQAASADEATTTVEHRLTPSGAVLELVQEQVRIQGKVHESDVAAGEFVQKHGKVVYLPMR